MSTPLSPGSQRALDNFNFDVNSEGKRGTLSLTTSRGVATITYIPRDQEKWYHKFFKSWGIFEIFGYNAKKIISTLQQLNDIAVTPAIKNLQNKIKRVATDTLDIVEPMAEISDSGIEVSDEKKLRTYLYTSRQLTQEMKDLCARVENDEKKNEEYGYLVLLFKKRFPDWQVTPPPPGDNPPPPGDNPPPPGDNPPPPGDNPPPPGDVIPSSSNDIPSDVPQRDLSKEVADILTEADEKKCSPIYLAALKNDVASLNKLIENGYKINDPDENGNTPLHSAVLNNNTDCLKVLLESGADVNAKDNNGHTPLHSAVKAGAIDCLKIFLNNESQIPHLDILLHLAVDEDKSDCLKVLLEKRVDVEAKDNNGHTPLYVAARSGKTNCLEVLLNSGAKTDVTDARGNTLLHAAVLHDNADCLNKLIAQGLLINATNNESRSPLHLAANNNSTNCLEILLEHNANVELKDTDNITPIDLAAKYAPDCLKVMLKHWAKEQTVREDSPLHIAALYNDGRVVQALLEDGADVNAKNADGDTPLHIAAKSDKEFSLEALLKKGANKTLKNNQEQTAFDVAADVCKAILQNNDISTSDVV